MTIPLTSAPSQTQHMTMASAEAPRSGTVVSNFKNWRMLYF
jgi:hypothetical protein